VKTKTREDVAAPRPARRGPASLGHLPKKNKRFNDARLREHSPVLYGYLLWATALGWLVFGDVPRPATLLGATIILLSGLYVYRHAGPEEGARLR
jgi:hypothetical protein